ncbi:MAG: HlyD family efflux transporter periplasmic adaptor subunit [Planctomycetota bacterium]|nr:HlyD family efflux transporter periplasmic adaptor subunit [Planctomycetota bacterium]
MVKWLTIMLALAGLAMGIYTVATAHEPLPKPPPAQPPSVNPYARGIAATGLVEAASRNVSVASPEPGLVVEVVAQPNAVVRKGDPLFIMDRRPLEAELVRMAAAVDVAKAELERIESQPRAEDIPPLKAALEAAKVQAADEEDQYQRTAGAFKASAASEGEVARRKFAAEAARARVEQAQATLLRMQAGAWAPELRAAKARVAQAEADVAALRIRLDRMTIRAPIDGTVMKRFIEPGEYAMTSGSAGANPAMVLGDLTRLHVRAQVDEEDSSLLVAGARGTARLRGAVSREYPLRMLRIEPWAQPKNNITGLTPERVDTRVVDVVFEMVPTGEAGALPYPGQLVDVYIETEGETKSETKVESTKIESKNETKSETKSETKVRP